MFELGVDVVLELLELAFDLVDRAAEGIELGGGVSFLAGAGVVVFVACEVGGRRIGRDADHGWRW